MTWKWSHTEQAYDDAKENLHSLSFPLLIEIAAEWKANVSREHCAGGFHLGKFRKATKKFQKLWRRSVGNPKMIDPENVKACIAESIWKLAADQRLCDNGGFLAWTCPYGCGCHCVAFDRNGKE